MLVPQKYANQKFAGLNMLTFTESANCQHLNGWYVTVKLWIFKKHIFVCSDCGENLPGDYKYQRLRVSERGQQRSCYRERETIDLHS